MAEKRLPVSQAGVMGGVLGRGSFLLAGSDRMAVRRAVPVARKEAVGIDSSDKGALFAKELATERSSSLAAFGSYLSRQRNYLSSFNPA